MRIYFRYLPNFAPVAALSLFAGFYFRRIGIAVCVPLLVMTISDYWIGGYHGGMMLGVYAALAIPILYRGLVRKYCKMDLRHRSQILKPAVGLFGFGLLSSLTFFIVSNFAVWCFSEMYQLTLSDLARCYTNALPFFRYTLAGDMTFIVVLFGSHALLAALYGTPLRTPDLSTS